ncbi:MAG: dihydroneopterin aldolase [Acidimicrobiaceae bacterium]|nr:dihydroneopterin aldolase [Acidimicrobiaceae bacterium]|tara:strand:- start:5382 stop:5747 length:366 start_codon:yes stop_codon:yes gene_type:complete
MTDRIELKGIRALGTIGVLTEEQERAQPFEVDITVESDLSISGKTDSLHDTVNYAEVTETIVSIITNEKHFLLERVAERIAEETLKIDLVNAVNITIKKLRPPVPHHLEYSAVTIRREDKL